MVRLMMGSSTCAVVWIPHGGETGELHCLLHWHSTRESHPTLVMETCKGLQLELGEMSLTAVLEGHLSRPSERLVRNEMERCQHARGVHLLELCLKSEDLCSPGSHRLATLECSREEESSVRW